MKKHLKESTDVTKSNKLLAVSIVIAVWGAVTVALLFRFFVGRPRDFLPQAIIDLTTHPIVLVIMGVGVVVALVALVGSINIKKFSGKLILKKYLLIIGLVVLYVSAYLPLILVVPEAIKSALLIEKTNFVNVVIRVATAIVLLIPAFVTYKKLHYLFDKK